MKKYILLLAITLVSVHTWAQENRTKTLINAALHGWEYEFHMKYLPDMEVLDSEHSLCLFPKKYATSKAITLPFRLPSKVI